MGCANLKVYLGFFGFEGFHGSAKKIKAREALFTVAYMEELWWFDDVEKLTIKVLILSLSSEMLGELAIGFLQFAGGCHGSVIWLPEKMNDSIPGAMFGVGSAFGPFHVFKKL
ncbi:hypothetical protein LR48_Vigan02g154600 [Vigna angularis]|uniref:Uncharacterized protein n=1 Tax=Phaseolus angularis TaxID=3914 RepID=A0A0L9TY09_PHAAN|nr:hypothetical protein LR48_Vigan02g154600 [Vigna angularis]